MLVVVWLAGPAAAQRVARIDGDPDLSGDWVLVRPVETEKNSLSADAATSIAIVQSRQSISIAQLDGPRQYPLAGEHRYGRSGMVAGSGASARTVMWFGDEFMVTQATRAGPLEPDLTEYAEGWRLQDDGSLRIEIVDNRSEDPPTRRSGVLVYRRK